MFSGLLAALVSEEEAGNVATAAAVPKYETLSAAGLTKAEEPKPNPPFILDQRRECLLMCLESKAIKDGTIQDYGAYKVYKKAFNIYIL